MKILPLILLSIGLALPVSAQDLAATLEKLRDAPAAEQNGVFGRATDIARHAPPDDDWLRDYVTDQSHPERARTWALRRLQIRDAQWVDQYLTRAVQDPSLGIRRQAIALALDQHPVEEDTEKNAGDVERYQTYLTAARHPKQITEIASRLRKLGQPTTTADAMAMIMRWHVIGPFDNVDGVGYDTVYPPQTDYLDDADVDLSATHPGKLGDVTWSIATADDNGTVDLAQHLDKEKGATAYAFVAVDCDQPRPATLRLKSVTANKVWVNGRPLMANSVYHSGTTKDQYRADFDLQSGRNTILIKTNQNEQTQGWAQVWEMQCRITDRRGAAIRLPTITPEVSK